VNRTNCVVSSLMAGVMSVALMTSGCGSTSAAKATAPPPSVNIVKVSVGDIPMYGEWVATLDGYVNAQIQPQVSGYVVKQHYREGSYVRKGEVLFEIDARPFQAALNQARAQLAQAQAKLALAEVNVKRDTPLAQQRAIAQSQLDSELGALQETKANVQAAEAAVETAQLNFEFTKVRSLIDGIAGSATVQMGNLVGPSSVLTTVSKLDPVKVRFPISEQEYMRFTSVSRGNGEGRTADVNSMPLELVLADGSKYPHKGEVIFTDREVDPRTGTIRLVATFANPGSVLRPGQFARVRAVTGVAKNAILIPQRAVADIQGDYQVAVVDKDNKVSMRKVKVGQRVGSMWVIDGGLNPGENVVADGGMKVRDGSHVNPSVEKTQEGARR
jgi:RND family efflux transporter MFP subunit